jgi:hypothetical protein
MQEYLVFMLCNEDKREHPDGSNRWNLSAPVRLLSRLDAGLEVTYQKMGLKTKEEVKLFCVTMLRHCGPDNYINAYLPRCR